MKNKGLGEEEGPVATFHNNKDVSESGGGGAEEPGSFSQQVRLISEIPKNPSIRVIDRPPLTSHPSKAEPPPPTTPVASSSAVLISISPLRLGRRCPGRRQLQSLVGDTWRRNDPPTFRRGFLHPGQIYRNGRDLSVWRQVDSDWPPHWALVHWEGGDGGPTIMEEDWDDI